MTDSYVRLNPTSTSYVGPDAVELARVITIRAALKLAAVGIRPARGVTPTGLLKEAGRICGKTYKRGEYDLARADLQTWINAMKAAIPVKDTRNGNS